MLLSLLFFALQIAMGLTLIGFFDKENRFSVFEKILGAIVIGGVVSGFFILGMALLLKSLLPAIYIFIFVALAIFFGFSKLWRHWPKISFSFHGFFSLKNAWLIPLLLILVLYWILLGSVLFTAPDGTLRGALVGWGDIALHINMIERMATAEPFIVDHPIMAGANLTYPFLINFISAIFLRLDGNMLFAFHIPLLLYGTTGLLLLFSIACRILKSRSFAIIALLLIMCGSGLGFWTFFKDANIEYQRNGLTTIKNFLQNPPHHYTHLDNRTGGKPEKQNTNDNIVWIAPVIVFLSHQRSFLLGLAIFSFLLLGIITYGKSPSFWRFGIIAGLLPFSHSHTFLALFFLMAGLFWFHLKNWKPWLEFGIICSIIALPQILYLKSSDAIISLSFIKPWFGWMTCEHSLSWLQCTVSPSTDTSPFLFWFKNFGIVFFIWLLTILIMGIFILIKKYRELLKELPLEISFVVASVVLFILPNLFLFQPWPFDNNKIIFYWWIIAILFCVCPFLLFFWRQNSWCKIFVITLLLFSLLAGSIDFVSRLISPRNLYFYGYSDSSNDKVIAAKWIKTATPANALFLTSPSIDPLPLFLAGRPVYLGFEGWLWTEGLDYTKNQRAAEEIFGGNLTLACRENIDYILLDDDARNNFKAIKEHNILSGGTVVFLQESSKRYIIKTPCP